MVSRSNVVLAAIGTITITLIGPLLGSIFSPASSPLSEYIKDNISTPPNTHIISAMTFDNAKKDVSKRIHYGDTIPSRAITFNFTSDEDSLFPRAYFSNFECSFDGAPFEDCMPPKPYGNLQTEVGHIFQVRAKGILGNTDKHLINFILLLLHR